MQRIDKMFLIEDEDEYEGESEDEFEDEVKGEDEVEGEDKYEEVEEDDDNEDDGDGNEDSTDQQSHQDHQFSRILNENLTGMRIYTTIPKIHKHKYFKIRLNGGKKYIHKQTAVWYLTNKTRHLSSDRLLRVQEMNKQET